VFEKLENVLIAVKRERPRQNVSAGVHHGHALRGRLGSSQFVVEGGFRSGGWLLSETRFDGHGNEVLLNGCNDFGIGINRLTDGSGEDSTSFVVGR
jgi:hypothetical protein